MKATAPFTAVIKEYLEKEIQADAQLAEAYNSPDKKLAECVNYILSTVQKSGNNGFADEEIYAMAKDYYMKKDVKVTAPKVQKIVINKPIEEVDVDDLTEEELGTEEEETPAPKYTPPAAAKPVETPKEDKNQITLFG